MYQPVEVTLTAVAMPYCARVREPVVPAGDSLIVSVVMAMVVALAELLMKVTAVPIGKATVPLAGIVIVARAVV